jgi:hypothetical protein
MYVCLNCSEFAIKASYVNKEESVDLHSGLICDTEYCEEHELKSVLE